MAVSTKSTLKFIMYSCQDCNTLIGQSYQDSLIKQSHRDTEFTLCNIIPASYAGHLFVPQTSGRADFPAYQQNRYPQSKILFCLDFYVLLIFGCISLAFCLLGYLASCLCPAAPQRAPYTSP